MVDTADRSLRVVRQLLSSAGSRSPLPMCERMLETIARRPRYQHLWSDREHRTFTCCHVMPADDPFEQRYPIGRPISNTQVYVLDGHLRPVADRRARRTVRRRGMGWRASYLNRRVDSREIRARSVRTELGARALQDR